MPEVRRELALYYDEITRLDGYVGQVLDELRHQGVADNTLVLFLSDNGRPFPTRQDHPVRRRDQDPMDCPVACLCPGRQRLRAIGQFRGYRSDDPPAGRSESSAIF